MKYRHVLLSVMVEIPREPNERRGEEPPTPQVSHSLTERAMRKVIIQASLFFVFFSFFVCSVHC